MLTHTIVFAMSFTPKFCLNCGVNPLATVVKTTTLHDSFYYVRFLALCGYSLLCQRHHTRPQSTKLKSYSSITLQFIMPCDIKCFVFERDVLIKQTRHFFLSCSSIRLSLLFDCHNSNVIMRHMTNRPIKTICSIFSPFLL